MAEKTLERLINKCVEKGAARSLTLTGRNRLKTKAGCERELDILENDETSPSGHVVKYSRKSYASRMKEQAWADWEHYRDAQPHLSDDTPPTDRFLNKIVFWEAAVKVYQMEADALRKRLQRFERIEEQERQRRIDQLRWKGIGKLVDNKLVEMDGRRITRNEQDEDIFEDTGNLVSEYRVEIKKRRTELRKKGQATGAAV